MSEHHSRSLSARIQHPAVVLGSSAPENRNVAVDCGWGRLIFGNTFERPSDLVGCLLREEPGKRDIAFYVADPHVALSLAPFDAFLDPSHTYRLNLRKGPVACRPMTGYRLRPLQS